MKTLYLDCGMGAAGDMLAAALLELLPEKQSFIEKMNQLGIPGVKVCAERSVKCGIAGTHFSVQVHGMEEDAHAHHHHGSMVEIRSIVSAMRLPSTVKLDVMAVYNTIAEAESQVHGVPVEHIHFHEVGSLDAIADITAVCLLMHMLDADQVLASPVHVGSGSVRCAHGILPVPAPATALILRDVPIYGGSIRGELCTPTGAALLKHFTDRFDDMPVMQIRAVGYGMGKKDFERANCVRAMLGDTREKTDTVVQLSCNLDDMTGEAIGFAMEQLLTQGALDVFTTPIGMKKNRPATMLSVLCREEEKEKFVKLIFRHTTTLGVREQSCHRYTLERRTETVQTAAGPVRKKISSGYGVRRKKYEYADLAKLAEARQLSLAEVLEELE